MSFEGMLFTIWIVSSFLTLMIFGLDERFNKENVTKVFLFSLAPLVNTAFVFRTFLSWFKND